MLALKMKFKKERKKENDMIDYRLDLPKRQWMDLPGNKMFDRMTVAKLERVSQWILRTRRRLGSNRIRSVRDRDRKNIGLTQHKQRLHDLHILSFVCTVI